jgi:hypothetical protein
MKKRFEDLSAFEWWSKRRFHYNIGLVIAGVIAFVAYATIVFSFEERIPDAEITFFSTMFQAVGYLIAMGIANIFYFLGPLSERILKPKNVTTYRKLTYNIGFWFSVLLPFSIPAFVGYMVASSA